MNILSWNCWGLGNLWTIRHLCQLIKEKHPSLVFLMETKLRSKKMELIRCKLGFKNLFVVDCVGKGGGGLAFLWKEEVELEIQNFSSRHINGIVTNPLSNQRWKFTGFYGQPDVARRYEGWDLLKQLANLAPEPWLCIGDFNEVLTMTEKWGGGVRANSQMREFQITMEFCEFTDLGYSGPKFTWSNCREEQDFIKERLDRGVANSSWRELFPEAEIVVEAVTTSDHAVLLASLEGKIHKPRRSNSFRYEVSWAAEKEFRECMFTCMGEFFGRRRHLDSAGTEIGVMQKSYTKMAGFVKWKTEAKY
jgi:exonuclease III